MNAKASPIDPIEKIRREVVIIGGGPAGLAAAIAAREAGCREVLLIERDRILGGILNQCIHDGFGLHAFKEALSGPEYADRYIRKLPDAGVEVMDNTIVLSLSPDRVLEVSARGALRYIEAGAVILAMGCRERTRGAISIPGHRPAGVYTAGAAQNFINLENIMVGSRVCILGSGDIGLIMARRMTLEGARVEAVFEILPYSSGLPRNIQQCLNDYNIPLFLNTTVTDIIGKGRLEAIRVAQVDGDRVPIPETERLVPCDTLLLSVGLIPENELTLQAGVSMDPVTGGALVDDTFMTDVPGIFACGNVLHVHDLADWVSVEAEEAGRFAAAYVQERREESGRRIPVRAGEGVRYVLPQTISGERDFILSLRVTAPWRDRAVVIRDGSGKQIRKKKMMRLHPAEMIRIPVKKGAGMDGSHLEVSVE
ncbi:MAG: FAD-dependent oxidoreductase [Acidobacteriota bacterium]|jgi:NADPH-dependent 2,4-dienoyl-CoA reductase/sulfur reductase-like enzyme|nr:FAD-dependent oxidoreductase [Acidobacteriota bacterium]